MVVAGLITGNHGKDYGMSDTSSEYIAKFWELIDVVLNALLFVIIGLELLIIETNRKVLFAAFILVGVVLLARYISVLIPSIFIRINEKLTNKALLLLTWGGLRGGISIALALSVPNHLTKDVWVTITYIIVCFSILVQGMTMGNLAKRMK